ncbi:ABC transporter ATP-binding protein [Frankia sp. AgW1.1]|uniref:ABC transporter ATP-binding protein n=1 Tax=Frankia sp. AgW1.1 TaxID=1836971 RepID=UPI001933ED25|nr:ABC transporter ATP-binding protein [Frankia sp. AgW1.1]MBL7491299.1 ABC transporter ATP-binding protein [Frankia sp. AgW1.1]
MTGTDGAARPDGLATPGGTAGVPIEMVGLGRDFGSVQALADVSMSVRPGEIVALLGPSGSGKSTLLRICAGLESASSGRLLFGGVDQAGIAPHQRDVSLVFQHYALYPHLSALDNLTLALRYGRRQPKKAAVARARETLDMLGIGALADRRPAQMSGGQRQRVAIGRALARQSRVVLLDEPMSGLDAKLRVELRVEIVGLLRRLGSTALFVTHDQAEAMAVGDRVAVLNAGRLEQLGTPDEVYDRPATRFVATFVGSPPMNVLDGTLTGGVLSGPGFAVAAPPGAAAVGVRPEGFAVAATTPASAAAPADGAFRLDGTVVVSERLGAERVIYVQTAAGTVAVRVPTATPQIGVADPAGAPSPAQPGRSVTLAAPAAACAFFGSDGALLPAPR